MIDNPHCQTKPKKGAHRFGIRDKLKRIISRKGEKSTK
jgi:hypothetical protein